VGMSGNLAVIQTATGLELRDAVTGQSQGVIAGVPSSFAKIGIADDGSYVWAAMVGGGLEAWSPQGAQLLQVPGDYSGAVIFAAPMELRVAKGAAGTNRIETIPLGGGSPTLSPTFSQPFDRWMEDGERFFAVVGTAVFIYSKNAALVASAMLPTVKSLGGTGNHFWSFDSSTGEFPLHIYDVGSGGTPIATYDYSIMTKIFSSKQGIGVLLYGDAEVHFIHLDPQFTREIVPLPFAYFDKIAVDKVTGFWTVSNNLGVIFHRGAGQDPQAQGTLGCGAVLDIAGAPTGRAAIAVASNRVVIVDMNAGGAIENVVPVWGEKVEMSSDGSVLGTWGGFKRAQYIPDRQVRGFSLPGGSELHAFPDSRGFSLARGGTRIGFTEWPGMARHVMEIGGMTTFFDDTGLLPVPKPSPSGATIAVSDKTDDLGTTTYLYQAQPMGGAPILVNAVPGHAVGWIDENRLLVYVYKIGSVPPFIGVYDKSFVYDAQGNLVASPAISKQIDDFDVTSASAIYSPEQRTIYDWTTGAASWTSPIMGSASAAAGSRVVMAYQDGVYVTSF
jgi:hypothetical protein